MYKTFDMMLKIFHDKLIYCIINYFFYFLKKQIINNTYIKMSYNNTSNY